MKIKDIVTMDEHGAFRSDVQLSDYEEPDLNLDLLRNYIFTTHTPVASAAQRDYASVDVLETLVRQAFRVERAGAEFNRIVLTANYGRGKSHLALVLANFFARPADSPEVKIVMERLEQALGNDKPRLENIREFKKERGAFLVVRLRGDYCDDLQDAFLRELEEALEEHPSTRWTELPFWYTSAGKRLNELKGEARQKADAFLATHNMDISLLIAQLRKPGSYDLVRETFKQVTGFYPDFGREINLKDLVIWAVDEVCIPNGLGGLLILFDEFSLFLHKYMGAMTAGKLQELLNGISDRPGKSAFLAFTQIDIDTVAETYAHGRQHLEDVKKELERLPKDKRARLFSLMESVLASYLKQNEKTWEIWSQQQQIKGPLAQAGATLDDYFGRRYKLTLRWDASTITETVVKGCYPLYPMTTAILSSHAFEAGTSENPRTALQFVRQTWESYQDRPAQRENGFPNFVFATTLVDFFGKQISEKWYAAYENALEISPMPLSEDHKAVLKALLLQQAVEDINRKKVTGTDQFYLIGQLSGLDAKDIKRLLREMRDKRVIYYDRYNKVSILPPVGMRSRETEEIIREAVDNTPLEPCTQKISESIPVLEISHGFGHVDDWSPRQIVLPSEQFTEAHLREIILPYCAGVDKIESNPRGWVIWLIAQNENEKITLRQSAQKILDQALAKSGDNPIPVVVVLPKRATPGLVESTRRLSALEHLSQTDREKIGTLAYDQEKRETKVKFDSELNAFLGNYKDLYAQKPRAIHEYALPKAYQTSVQVKSVSRDIPLKVVLSECYRQSYKFRLEFYAKYRVGGKGRNQLRTAVQNVSLGLFSDEIAGSLSTVRNKDIQYQLSTSYLPHTWGLLTADTHVIQPPTKKAIREAWNLLENTFSPGCKEVRVTDSLIELLNPPYGHDYNTLILLFSAWIGYHRHEIRLSLAGKIVSLSEFKNLFDESKTPHEFFNKICLTLPLAISRMEKDKLFAEAIDILDRIKQGEPAFSIAQASDALAQLETTSENPALPAAQQEEINALRPRLDTALRNAQEYDEQASHWLAQLATADFHALPRLQDDLNTLAAPALVIPDKPALDILRQYWEEKVKQELDLFCTRYAQLQELSDYKSHVSELKRALRWLREYPDFSQRVETALRRLEKQRDELKQQESEKSIIAEINSMTPSAGLAVLYQYRERLESLQGLSEKTAQKRDAKAQQVETRIRQYETLEDILPVTIENATKLSDVRELQRIIFENREQVKGTHLYTLLEQLLDKTSQLETFINELQALDTLPTNTPDDLIIIRQRLSEIENRFAPLLAQAQLNVLREKGAKFDRIQREKMSDEQEWFKRLENRFAKGENPNVLLRELETHRVFWNETIQGKVEQVKQALHKQLSENALAQIEALFLNLAPDSRHECLQRLQQILMDASK